MIERNDGKEKIAPEFSAIAQIYDKKRDINYAGKISLPFGFRFLKDFTAKPAEGGAELSFKVRFDSSGKGANPDLIIKNHDGKEIIYMLRERFDKKLGLKYFSLGAPPQDIRNFGKAVKADFRVFLDLPGI
jgi:hypothetical protein